MLRTILLLLLGYLVWTIFRIFQRINRTREATRRDYGTVRSTGDDRRKQGGLPEIKDAEFEDIDPKKSDTP